MRRHPLALTLAALPLLAGCGPTVALHLDLRAVSITVPRLVTPAITLIPAAPPAYQVPLPRIELPPPPPPTAALPVYSSPRPPAPACPKASEFAVPAVPAAVSWEHAPVNATYTMTSSGAFTDTVASQTLKGTLIGTQTVQVKRLPTTQTSIGQTVEAYQVTRIDRLHRSSSVEVYQLVEPSTNPAATAAGIYLAGMSWSDPVRGTLSLVPQDNNYEILPLPVAVASSAAQYANVITDPNSLATLALVRNVTGKTRVDACGQLIDTYTVQMTGTLTTRDTQRQVTWTQQIATAYGGLDVEDTLTLTSATPGFSWTRSAQSTTLPRS